MKWFIYIALSLFAQLSWSAELNSCRKQLSLMGSDFDLQIWHDDPDSACMYLDRSIEMIRGIEAMISSWNANSITARVNRKAASEWVPLEGEYFAFLQDCIRLSELTDGAFDISIGPLLQIWSFEGQERAFPDSTNVRKQLEKVGHQYISLDEPHSSIHFEKAGMRLGFGAIGKGYAADRVIGSLQKWNIPRAIIDCSGDIRFHSLDGSKFPVHIASPDVEGRAVASLKVENLAVVTSGDYERFFTHDGKQYGHIIDPRTGYPCSAIRSATVLCKSGAVADGLATALLVLGVEKGMELINRLDEIEAVMIDAEGNLFGSNGISLSYED